MIMPEAKRKIELRSVLVLARLDVYVQAGIHICTPIATIRNMYSSFAYRYRPKCEFGEQEGDVCWREAVGSQYICIAKNL
jgi:hypothetical protein